MLRDCGAILSIQVGVDFVEQMEGGGVASLDRENEGQCAETFDLAVSFANSLCQWRLTLLTTRELLNPLLFIMFAVEADTDAHTSIVLDRISSLLVLRIFLALSCWAVGFPLNNESSATCGNQF